MAREFHEVANIFPLMQGNEFEALKADIASNGQREPIWLHTDGSIIDGRNRYRACMDLDIQPVFRTWDGKGSLVAFVVSLNLHRRHLTSGQRAVIALDILPMLESEAKKNQRLSPGRGNGKGFQNFENLFGEQEEVVVVDPINSTEQAAQMLGTNRQYVSDVKRIAHDAPDLLEKVRTGETNITTVKRELKERKREERRRENAVKAASTPSPLEVGAKFATILIDPPWDWGDEGDVNQMGRAKPDYGTMGIDELERLPVADLADDDCHLYLWITNRSLPKGFRLLEAWGFRYVTCVTWAKPHFGMGNYFRGQTEHLLFGVKGSQMLKRRDAGTIFYATRGDGGHSSKPNEAYELIESCSPAPYLEMFSRRSRLGWSMWGGMLND